MEINSVAPINIMETEVANIADRPFNIPNTIVSGHIRKPKTSDNKKNGDRSFADCMTSTKAATNESISIVNTFNTKPKLGQKKNYNIFYLNKVFSES